MKLIRLATVIVGALLCAPALSFAQFTPGLGNFQTMHAMGGADGASPYSGLTRGADGKMYGVAAEGGASSHGTVFRITPGTGVLEVLKTFTNPALDGSGPTSLMRASDDYFYGTTEDGGTFNAGTIFRIKADGSAFSVIHSFNCALGEGGDPFGTLTEGPDGALYGMTNPRETPITACHEGVPSTVFRVNKDGSGFHVLRTLSWLVEGAYNYGAVAVDRNGAVYGTTIDAFVDSAPANSYGTIFKIDKDGNTVWVHSFNGIDGLNPYSGVVRGADGALYGTTYGGGAEGVGAIFRITENGDFSIVYSFSASSINSPIASVTIGGDGVIYGAASAGGANNAGGTYVFDPVNGFAVHHELDPVVDGSTIFGTLGVAGDRHLYGGAINDGANFQGSTFGLLDLQVADRPPYAVATANPNPANATSASGAAVDLSGAGSSDPDFDPLTYSWTLPPGVTYSGSLMQRDLTGVTFPAGTSHVTLTVSDGTLENFTAFDVVVNDQPPTLLNVPADIATPFQTAAGAVVTYTPPTATDVVDGTVPVVCNHPSGSTFPIGVTTVTCSATDTGGNTVSAHFTVTVQDSVTVVVPANITIGATGPAGAVVTFSASASSGAVPSLPVVCNPASGATFPIGITTVLCSASDSAGNTDSQSFTVTVLGLPTWTVPGNQILEATSSAGAPFSFTATAISPTAGSLAVTCLPASGSTFPLDVTTTVTCSATDPVAGVVTRSFDVKVQDHTAPTIAMNINGIEYNATGPSGAVVIFQGPTANVGADRVPSATDLVDGSVAVVCNPPSGLFPLGTTLVTCTATDAHLNTSTFKFNVAVRDSDFPVLTLPSNVVLEAAGPAGTAASFVVSATDFTTPAGVQVQCSTNGPGFVASPLTISQTFPLGVTTVTCVARDSSGHQPDPQSFTVTVRDTIAPVISGTPANITLQALLPTGVIVNYAQPTALDAVSGTVPVICVPPSGSLFAIGSVNVTCSATDGSGNTSTTQFRVTITDGVKPVVTVPADITLEAAGPGGASTTFTATSIDNTDGPLPVICSPASGSTFPIGTTTVNCSATDSTGNTGSSSFKIIVRDTTAPVVTVPANITAEALGPGGAAVTYSGFSATDAVGVTSLSCSPASGSTFPIGTNTVTCTAKDAANNSGSKTFTITVRDTIAPVVTVPADKIVEATSAGGAAVSYTGFSATDAVGIVSLACVQPSGSTFPLGTSTVVCTATDAAGNTGTNSFKITVRDTTGPAISGVSDMTVVASGPTGKVVTFTATAVDLVDGSRPVICTPPSGSLFPIGTTLVTCTSTDSRGNTSTKTFNVVVKVSAPPTVTISIPDGQLWPPNHKMRTVHVSITATDGTGVAPKVILLSVTSNEPDNGLGDGDTANDIQGVSIGTDDRVFQLRAERSGLGTGRIYTATYKIVNAIDPTIFTIATATAVVPHDMGN